MTLRQALTIADQHFPELSTSRYHSKLLIGEVLKISLPQIYMLDANSAITPKQEADLLQRLERIDTGEPFDYVVGYRMFCGLPIHITQDVLIPRPETEELAQLVMNSPLFANGSHILEIGTGSGCVSVTLIHQAQERRFTDFRLTGIDLSAKAIAITKKNLEKVANTQFNGVDLKGNFTSESGSINLLNIGIEDEDSRNILPPDIIVANPPYLTQDEMLTLDKSVAEHEPALALSGGVDGLDVYRKIATYIATLPSLPELYLEIGPAIADSVEKLFREIYPRVEIREDIFSRVRFLVASS